MKKNAGVTNGCGIKAKTAALVIGLMIAFTGLGVSFAAGPSYGENIVKWLMEQLVWVAIGATAIAAVIMIMARSWTKMIVTILVGGALSFLFSQPTVMKDMGAKIFAVFNGS